jgi:hypothetical protein
LVAGVEEHDDKSADSMWMLWGDDRAEELVDPGKAPEACERRSLSCEVEADVWNLDRSVVNLG